MIQVTRLNGSELWLNPFHIESIEANPDSVISLTNNHKYLVRENPVEIQAIMVAFYERIGIVQGTTLQGGKG